MDDNQFTITINNESGPLSFIHADSETIVGALNHIKHRYHLTQPESYTPHTKIKPKDVPGTLLNVVCMIGLFHCHLFIFQSRTSLIHFACIGVAPP